jgi:hypothetical protein
MITSNRVRNLQENDREYQVGFVTSSSDWKLQRGEDDGRQQKQEELGRDRRPRPAAGVAADQPVVVVRARLLLPETFVEFGGGPEAGAQYI